MTEALPPQDHSDLLGAITVAPAEIDHMSDIRHLHVQSARRLAAGMLSEAEIVAFTAHLQSVPYSTRIAAVVQSRRLLAGRLSNLLVGTAGWTPANDSGTVARLVGVFVSPHNAGIGVGRLLVEAVEMQARQAGFAVFTIRAPLGASGFFAHLGYEVASHGVWPLDRETAIPVAFMRKSDQAKASTAG